jgi:hypothetical protein
MTDEEHRSMECWRYGGEWHRKCTDWNCECLCHKA